MSADWGQDVTNQALIALASSWCRSPPGDAVRAEDGHRRVASLVHDMIITAGVYSLIGFEVTPATVIGLLTILGFSLYDTVVVFDKVEENTRGLDRGVPHLHRGGQPGRQPDPDAVDQHLGDRAAAGRRSAVRRRRPARRRTLKDLALVLFVGLLAGAYSSLFLATPIVADLEEREPEQIALRRRVLARRSAAVRKAGAAVPGRSGGQCPAGSRRVPRSPSPSATCPARWPPTSSSSHRRRSGGSRAPGGRRRRAPETGRSGPGRPSRGKRPPVTGSRRAAASTS